MILRKLRLAVYVSIYMQAKPIPQYIDVIYGNTFLLVNTYLIQNSQAVKKVCGPQKGYGEKRCEIQGGGQEMAVMVG